MQQYIEHAMFPNSSTPEQRDRLRATAPKIRSAVARFFSGIDNANFAAIVAEVNYEYHADLLDLMGRSKIFERCDSNIAIPALKAAGVHLGEMLASKSLVNAYDSELRDELRTTNEHRGCT